MKQIALLLLSLIILCTACSAQAAEKELPVFTSIWDAVNSTEGYAEVHDNEDYAVLIVNMDDRYLRMFSLLDDKTAKANDYPTDLLDVYAEYAWSLPLSCIEELPEPLSQAELDGLKGKTLQQLMDDDFGKEMILHESELASMGLALPPVRQIVTEIEAAVPGFESEALTIDGAAEDIKDFIK